MEQSTREFCEFTEENGVKHTPKHPRSNGIVDSFVQTFEQSFKVEGSNSVKQRLDGFCQLQNTK